MENYVRKPIKKFSFKTLKKILEKYGIQTEEQNGLFYINLIERNSESGYSFVVSEPNTLKINNNLFKWKCNAHDNKHGSFHPDYEGSCGETGYSNSLKEAQQACIDHRKNCQFGNENFTIIFNGGNKKEIFNP